MQSKAFSKRKQPNRLRIVLIITLISILFLFISHRLIGTQPTDRTHVDSFRIETARVQSIDEVIETSHELGAGDGFQTKQVMFSAKLLSGGQKGITVTATQSSSSYMALPPREVKTGEKVLLIYVDNGLLDTDWVYSEHVRTDALLWLGLLFAGCLLILGKMKGLQTILSLGITIAAVFMLFIPAVLAGRNIYFWTFWVGAFIVLSTVFLVGGVNRKSAVAIMGCLGGIAGAALLVGIMNVFLQLTGYINDESYYLVMMNPQKPIDLKAVIFGAIIIGATGAIMDVAMSIASSLFEIKKTVPQIKPASLIKSGMQIGRDVMGTMANTLILAYIGGSLSLILILIAYKPNLTDLLNREMIVAEILQALIGSMGILMTVPLTTLAAAFLYGKIRTDYVE